MGTKCHIVVEGGEEGLLEFGSARVSELDQRWSRFSTASEVSRLNDSGTRGMKVSGQTLELVRMALVAQQITGGLFDSFMGTDIAAAGYDRDFTELVAVSNPAGPSRSSWDGCRRVDVVEAAREGDLRLVDAKGSWVRLPTGYELDSGGLGKGLAADIVSRELMAQGAIACLVSLGGDLRVRGKPERGEWEVGIDDESGKRKQSVSVKLRSGGLCTSSLAKRRWVHKGEEKHHLLDPRTGVPMHSDLAAATVIAPQAWLAEVLSKTLMLRVGPRQLRLLRSRNGAGILQTWRGEIIQVP